MQNHLKEIIQIIQQKYVIRRLVHALVMKDSAIIRLDFSISFALIAESKAHKKL